MRPHLVRWQEDYAKQGLVVIEVTGGEQEPLNVVKAIVEKQKLNHPVLWDHECRNHDNYGLKNWPVAYLVDTEGKVVWEGNPARVVNRSKEAASLRRLIESKLAQRENIANNEQQEGVASDVLFRIVAYVRKPIGVISVFGIAAVMLSCVLLRRVWVRHAFNTG